MISTEPNVVMTGRYASIDAAKILEIDRKTLYNWSKQGTIKFGVRRTNGRRFFTGAEIIRCWRSQF